jgi:endonuclease YncB( thermonuclease family)
MAPRLLTFIVSALAFATPVAAAPLDASTLVDLGTASIETIGDDGAMTLTDGRKLRLAGIELIHSAPAHDMQQTLRSIIGSASVTLKGDGPDEDRYGRVIAQVFTADGTWVEGALLRQGLARVATTPDHCEVAAALYTAERPARTHRLGLWGDARTALRHADAVMRFIDSWQVVDGTVIAVTPRHNAIDLHFGDDEAHDLSIRIPGAIAEGMQTDPASLIGRHLRVRGWIGKGIGPLIVLNHAEQIEIVGRRRQRVADDQ